jgi:hypothetical protein
MSNCCKCITSRPAIAAATAQQPDGAIGLAAALFDGFFAQNRLRRVFRHSPGRGRVVDYSFDDHRSVIHQSRCIWPPPPYIWRHVPSVFELLRMITAGSDRPSVLSQTRHPGFLPEDFARQRFPEQDCSQKDFSKQALRKNKVSNEPAIGASSG